MKRGATITLVNPASESFASNIVANARHCRDVVQPESAKGRHLVLCGAGPSLAEHAAEYCTQGDQVWACNGALGWLIANGHHVTHGFTVNQLDAGLWSSAPDVEYIAASSAHPAIVDRLAQAGRRMAFFHNFINCRDQDRLYADYYPTTVCAGSGLNAVTRALDVASYMGFETITVLGADCCLRGEVMHVDGSTAAESGCSDVMLSGEIDGRTRSGQADLWITANWITRMARASGGKIRLVGDTLPVALAGKPLDFLDRLPHSVDLKGNRIPIPF